MGFLITKSFSAQSLFPVACAPRWDQQLPQQLPWELLAPAELLVPVGGISYLLLYYRISLAPQRAKECLEEGKKGL